MPSPTPATTATATATTTYTTIPISGTDVIFRSFQNLSSFLSLRRPWPEFISTAGSYDRPESFAVAGARIRANLKYFSVNYGIIATAIATVSLIGDPTTLLTLGLVFIMWLVLYFFREDPMVVWGYHVHDHLVTVCLVFITGIAIWTLGFGVNLIIGIVVGGLISIVHGVFRNPQGVYLDEFDAASEGLVSSPSASSSNTTQSLSMIMAKHHCPDTNTCSAQFFAIIKMATSQQQFSSCFQQCSLQKCHILPNVFINSLVRIHLVLPTK